MSIATPRPTLLRELAKPHMPKITDSTARIQKTATNPTLPCCSNGCV